jgi:hypothetical protein
MTPPSAAAAAPAVHPRRPLAPRAPRRVSGPARRARPARSRRDGNEAGFALGVISAFEALAQHRMLDRLIRGRTWIGIVAFALIGIVTLQLGLLKLNGGIGRALEHEAVLQRQNATLAIENSELAAGTRVQARAAALGMSFASAGALHFLSSATHGDVAKAATALSTPTHAVSSESGESSAPAGETSSESPAASESTEAPAPSTESSAQSEASSTPSGEAAAGESSAGSESAARESSTATTGETESAGTAAQTGAGGGIQATSPGE